MVNRKTSRPDSELIVPVQLRPFRAPDLETLLEIDQACFSEGVSYSREELEDFIAQPTSRTWLAVEGEAVVGFLVADRQANRAGHIITVDVVERWRRRGVGKQLMDAAEDWAERLGLRLMVLETAEDNYAARRFYEGRGYEKVKRVGHYYANGAAAWVMVKKLGDEATANGLESKRKTSGA
jgi:[ribosomal protein S18]-alanine N-acetyltransferase